MAKDKKHEADEGDGAYREDLYRLQVELVKLQRHVIEKGLKLLILFEGRDAAGKDGTIKRVTEHMSPRETRVVALGKPTERESSSWYFQRWVPHLPAAGEIVCFNRSWYNRAGVERVMGYCTEAELDEFFDTAPFFEQMLVRSGISLHKYYLDIDRDTQAERLEDRRKDPLKQWKVSPVDEAALAHWKDYSRARNEMFARTHHASAPWSVVRAGNKKKTRLNVIRDLLTRCDYEDKDRDVVLPDPAIVFLYEQERLANGDIAA